MPEGDKNMFQIESATVVETDEVPDDVQMSFVPGLTEEEKEAVREELRPIVRAMRTERLRQADR